MLSRTPSPNRRTLRLSDAVALYIIIELAEGVHFAHELRGPDGQPLGLVHRDISPTNVLISYAGEVKLSPATCVCVGLAASESKLCA